MRLITGRIVPVLQVPVAQWIERQPPELEAAVRVRPGTPQTRLTRVFGLIISKLIQIKCKHFSGSIISEGDSFGQ